MAHFRALSWFPVRPARLLAGTLLALTAAAALAVQAAGPSSGGTFPSPGPDGSGQPGASAVLAAGTADVTQGALRVTRGDQVVECPLRHTDVRAEISGFIARVRVTQTFENPYDDAIEAVYVFPLPHGAAVDEMTMVVGERRISGVVKRRDEARETYEQAIASGYTASLLEQERPNIFTQTVGNIPGRQQVQVEIAYVDVLPYEDGRYEFHFPMVVGPRYIPGAPTGRQGTGWAHDTTRVPDASRITPPVLKPGFRTGHDVSLTVALDAGVPVQGLKVHAHEARVHRAARERATVTLAAEDSIPNKDFVLSYHVAGERPQTALLSHGTAGDDGYFLMMVQPREMEEALRASPPRDVCFLIDVSGSMSGEPIAKVAEAMEQFFARMRAQDRLQVVTFAGSSERLFPGYVPASRANVARALAHTRRMEGGGGTEMLKGIKAVLADPVDPDRVRVVVMLTDGYIGNEDEIIGEVGRRAGDQVRFWTVGIGSSPNRHLLDGVARQGGGASGVLGLRDDPAPLVGSIMERIQRAQLSRIEIDWGGLDVYETYPARLGELWAGRPLFLLGRYRGQGEARLRISGLAEGEAVAFETPVALAVPGASGAHAVLEPAWARKKIEHLSDQMAVAGPSEELVEEVTELALRYRLMSAYTSFVAVDESQAVASQPPRRVVVPVPMPDGVSYEGVSGDDAAEEKDALQALGYVSARRQAEPRRHAKVAMNGSYAMAVAPAQPAAADVLMIGAQGGVPGGVVPRGVVGGVVGGLPGAPPPPAMAAGRAMHEAVARRRDADPQVIEYRRRAEAARSEAARLGKSGDLDGAVRELAFAAVAQQALVALAREDDGTAALVTGELDAANAAREERAAREIPALGRRLNVVIRNADIASALELVAGAAGVTVHLAPGSAAAAAAAFGPPAERIPYLDLRGATAARALTALTQPAGLVWAIEGQAVRVRAGAWAREAALSRGSDETAATARLARRRERARRDIDVWTWRLLAAALERRVDAQAASELLEAWSVPGVAQADALTLRSLWAVDVARRAVPADAVLPRLWDTAVAAARPVVAAAAATRLAGEAALYALLLRASAPEALPLADPEFTPGTPHEAIARALRGAGAGATGIADAITAGALSGDDGLVLAAVAVRRQDRGSWARFRDRAADLARACHASGGALQVVNRLERF